ncbi:MAG: type I methionyl aminopeptidase [Planctomycetota bacterium]
MIPLKTPQEIERIGAAGAIVGNAFQEIAPLIKPGSTTAEIDTRVRDFVLARSGELLFHNYRGFPGHCCISVNEEVVHGIPGSRVLNSGDVVSVDIGVRLDGFCGDSARTFFVEEPADSARRLVACCRNALVAGITAAQLRGRISDIGRAIQDRIQGDGYEVVTQYVGHGIGREMHEEPHVPNFVDEERLEEEDDPELEEGMVLAIEPMVVEHSVALRTLSDGWTVVTRDGGIASHWEHTVAITAAGPRILTLGDGESWPADGAPEALGELADPVGEKGGKSP